MEKIQSIKKPFILSIFGASGNLAQAKLFPSLYKLMEQNRLPKKFFIVGYARTNMTRKQFQNYVKRSLTRKKTLKVKTTILNELLKHFYYFPGQYKDIKDFETYQLYLKKIHPRKIIHLAYFSIPPSIYKDVIKNLGETRKSKSQDIRLIIEKPFGENQKSAKDLFHFTARYFDEKKVYLLDHYLGKTAVQSILNLRHSNKLINLILKGPTISNIQITAFEEAGVGNRAGYFNDTGTIKDMIQSHLLQLLALITMSIPLSEDENSLQREKFAILSALKFHHSKKNIALGQYKTYKEEKNIPKNSKTETFAALRLFIDRESWYKVPIYLRTGKKLNEKHTYIVIEIKKFEFQDKNEPANLIIIELQPEEKINIRLINKSEKKKKIHDIVSSHSIACANNHCLPEHSLLLMEVMQENHLHFTSFPEIITSWELTDQIIKYVHSHKVALEKYNDCSTGPKKQCKITEMDGNKWHHIH